MLCILSSNIKFLLLCSNLLACKQNSCQENNFTLKSSIFTNIAKILFLYFASILYITSDLCSKPLQVIAESLSEEEIGGLRELFKMIDTDNSGTITFEELKVGLKKVGSEMMESDIRSLMDAVSSF